MATHTKRTFSSASQLGITFFALQLIVERIVVIIVEKWKLCRNADSPSQKYVVPSYCVQENVRATQASTKTIASNSCGQHQPPVGHNLCTEMNPMGSFQMHEADNRS